jgi:hypothetical protein
METSVWSLWLPIVVSGIALFFASFAAWMLLPHHKPEWKGVEKEDALLQALRSAGVGPGQYMFPYSCKPEDWKSEEFKRRQEAGPTGTLIVWSRQPNMGVNMACTVVFFTVVSAVIAYLAGIAIPPGADFLTVFRFVGTAGILTYGTANILNGIWFGRKMVADIVDGIAYGVITGLIFAALWPGGPTGA